MGRDPHAAFGYFVFRLEGLHSVSEFLEMTIALDLP